MNKGHSLKVKIYSDGADRASMLEMGKNPLIQGADHESHPDEEVGHHRLPGLLQGYPFQYQGQAYFLRGFCR